MASSTTQVAYTSSIFSGHCAAPSFAPPTAFLSLLTISTRCRFLPPLRASRRFPNYPHDAVVVVPGARPWIRGEEEYGGAAVRDDGDEDENEEEEDDDDRSLDLLVRFLQSMFRKMSRRVRKAVRSVLPPTIPTKLVRFSVDGALVLAFLWTLKAFLEVVCTFGSMVFIGILLVRGIWSAVSYIKEGRHYYAERMDTENSAWNGIRTAT